MSCCPAFRLLFIAIIAIAIGISRAMALDVLDCSGPLPLWGGDGQYWVKLTSERGRIRSNESQHLLYIVGLEPKRPFFLISPWGGITIREFKENFQKDFDVKVATDGERALEIVMKGKRSQFNLGMNCSVDTDFSDQRTETGIPNRKNANGKGRTP